MHPPPLLGNSKTFSEKNPNLENLEWPGWAGVGHGWCLRRGQGWQAAPARLRETSGEATQAFALQISPVGSGGEGESSEIFRTVLLADQQRSASRQHVLK